MHPLPQQHHVLTSSLLTNAPTPSAAPCAYFKLPYQCTHSLSSNIMLTSSFLINTHPLPQQHHVLIFKKPSLPMHPLPQQHHVLIFKKPSLPMHPLPQQHHVLIFKKPCTHSLSSTMCLFSRSLAPTPSAAPCAYFQEALHPLPQQHHVLIFKKPCTHSLSSTMCLFQETQYTQQKWMCVFHTESMLPDMLIS